MAISYNKLWKLLVDKKMSKADTLTVLNKICTVLNVDIGDIMEFVPESIADYSAMME